MGHRGKFWCNILDTPGTARYKHDTPYLSSLVPSHFVSGSGGLGTRLEPLLFVQRPLSLHVSYAWLLKVFYTSTHSLYTLPLRYQR